MFRNLLTLTDSRYIVDDFGSLASKAQEVDFQPNSGCGVSLTVDEIPQVYTADRSAFN